MCDELRKPTNDNTQHMISFQVQVIGWFLFANNMHMIICCLRFVAEVDMSLTCRTD